MSEWLVPINDQYNDSWIPSGGGDLYPFISDYPLANDSTYVQGAIGGTDNQYDARLTTPSPITIQYGSKIYIRYCKFIEDPEIILTNPYLIVRLLVGATLITTPMDEVQITSDTVTELIYDLSNSEVDSINGLDRSQIDLRFIAVASGSPSYPIRITDAALWNADPPAAGNHGNILLLGVG